MADAVRVEIDGVNEVQRKLQELAGVAQKKVIRSAIRQAAKPIIEDARRRAPSKRVAKGVRMVKVKADQDGTVTAMVGLPGGRRPWYHGLFVEMGTGPRVQKNGRRTGSMPAKPFLRPAFDSQKAAVVERFGAELVMKMEKVARG